MGVQFALDPRLGLRLNWDHYRVSAYLPQGAGLPGIRATSPATVTGATLLYHC